MRDVLSRNWFRVLILSLSGLLVVGCAATTKISLSNRVAATPIPAATQIGSPRMDPPSPTAVPDRPTQVSVSPASGSSVADSETVNADQIRIQNTSSSLDSTGKLHITGEIANNSDSTIYDPTVVVEFHGADGALAGVQSTSALVRMIGKGEKGPFLMSANPPKGWAKVSYSLTYETSSPLPASHSLQFSEQKQFSGNAINVNRSAIDVSPSAIGVDSSALNVSSDARFFVGKVTNNSPHTLHFTTIILTGYDANGKVVRATATFVGKSGDLASGATAPYQLMLSSSDAKAVKSVVIMAEGVGD